MILIFKTAALASWIHKLEMYAWNHGRGQMMMIIELFVKFLTHFSLYQWLELASSPLSWVLFPSPAIYRVMTSHLIHKRTLLCCQCIILYKYAMNGYACTPEVCAPCGRRQRASPAHGQCCTDVEPSFQTSPPPLRWSFPSLWWTWCACPESHQMHPFCLPVWTHWPWAGQTPLPDMWHVYGQFQSCQSLICD